MALDLRQVAAGRVEDALGLRGRARRVEDEERVLGVHRLGLALGVGVGDARRARRRRAPPSSAGRSRSGRRRRCARAIEHAVGDVVDRRLHRHRLAAASVASAVISAFASENSIRSRTDSAEKPPKTTLWIAPIRAQREHRDDGLGHHRHVDPDDVALADAEVLEHVREALRLLEEPAVGDRPAALVAQSSASSASQWNATRSPLPAATCRSRQLAETFSLPPPNHFACGGSDQSRTSSQGSIHSSFSAQLAHQASGSACGPLVDAGVGDVRLRGELGRAAGRSARSPAVRRARVRRPLAPPAVDRLRSYG